MYKLFLTLRYLRKRRIAFFAIVGVWLCVAMVVVVLSVMGGFLDTLKERSRGLLSDIVIDNATLQGFPLYEEFVQHLKQAMPDQIAAATPVIYNYGILRVEQTSFTKPVQIVGIDLPSYESVNDFESSLFYDKYFPGTTRLGPQQQPVYGYDDNLSPILPDDHDRAFREWKLRHPNDADLIKWQRDRPTPYPWPGVFQSVDFIVPPDVLFDNDHADAAEDLSPRYYGDEAPGIIVGVHVINDRAPSGEIVRVTPRGAKLILVVIPLTGGGNLSGEGAITVVMRLADDSRTRVFEIDERCCYVDFTLMQKWLGMAPMELEGGGHTLSRTSQLLVGLTEGAELRSARERIHEEWNRFMGLITQRVNLTPVDRQLLNFVTVETWEERQAQFIAALEKEKILMTILFTMISLVAVVLIGCIFWMIVTQKTRDIGIMKSLGGSARGVALIFVIFGAAVGLIGAILGVATGAVFVWYINDIQDALVAINPNLRVWSPDVYTFDRIPNVVKIPEVSIIALASVFASMVGSIIPAILAGRVWPVKALRYE